MSDRSKQDASARIEKRPCRNILLQKFIYLCTCPVGEEARNGANDIVCCTCRSMVAGNIVMLDLFSEDKPVGRLKVAVKQALTLAGGTGNLTQALGEHLAQTNLTGSGEDTAPPNALVGNVTDSNLAPLGFSHLKASIILSPSRSRAVSFESIAGAAKVDINDVFLSFHNALLHVAQMQSFSSTSPSGNLHLHMQQTQVGCQRDQG